MLKKKTNLRIIAVASVTFFTLFSCVMGVFAWFEARRLSTSSTEDFQVVSASGSCRLTSLELYKFEYHKTTVDSFLYVDYLYPETGSVSVYAHNGSSFGYQNEEEEWQSVNAMNLYDPIEFLVDRTKALESLNCGVIYKATISANVGNSGLAEVNAFRIADKEKEENDIFLSSCIDFDVFFEDDLSESNFSETSGIKEYCPSYKTSNLTNNEKIYYKCACLAAKRRESGSGHDGNFYEFDGESAPSQVQLVDDKRVDLNDGSISMYIYVNYARNQLNDYESVVYSRNTKAVYDFGFDISIGPEDPAS